MKASQTGQLVLSTLHTNDSISAISRLVNLGVPAYLSTLQDPSSVGITFGKGRFVVTVSGTSKMDVDRVARSLLGQIAD